ncbi:MULTISPECIES: diguanylate cyclase [unclassified Fusibacter]|uniref:sensor domain-containing diguanylate cyclase n=1 Tax=unclassified Fusibacter TaxID=2624464 RepID=UPI0013E937BA|nr:MULTISPECIES: diguanylate cyclase [unclassified Fusibacter]MCK8059802.1 diguanylate cyclase [Fusibacter sp. A2]NPE21603.1 diguanylate cyclase [Fusibacter sp. A1]
MGLSQQEIGILSNELNMAMSTNPIKAYELVEDLLGSVEAQDDLDFYFELLLKKANIELTLSHYSQSLNSINHLIAMCYDHENYTMLCKAFNSKGNALAELGVTDRALNAYMKTMRLGEEHKVELVMSVGANNIGELYNDLGDIDSAYHYYELAYKHLDETTSNRNLYHRLKSIILINLGEIEAMRKAYEKAMDYCNQVYELSNRENVDLELSHVKYVEMIVHFGRGEYELMDARYKESIEICQQLEDNRNLIRTIIYYSKLKGQLGADLTEIIEILEFARSLSLKEGNLIPRMELHVELAKAYDLIGDQEKSIEYFKAYQTLEKEHSKQINLQQINAMQIRFEIEESLEERAVVKQKNEELRLKSDELVAKKNQLEQAYTRIQLISKIGQQITSTLDLSEIMFSVFNSLRSHMPIDAFIMVMLNDEGTHLVNLTTFEEGQLESDICISIEDPNSLLAKVYRESSLVRSGDVALEMPEFSEKMLVTNEIAVQSLICVPLRYNDNVIGVCSVQCYEKDGYDEDQFDLINALSAYLAIAINNAKKSKKLEQEITTRLKAQRELERLNAELKNISEIDGLTKVPNRRRFEDVFEQLFEIAMIKKTEIHLMMIDIDYFKMFNDHYGHLKGDEVLIAVAQKLNKAFRFSGRLFARYGGEEFVAVMTDITSEEAYVLAQELRTAISELGIINEMTTTGFLTISIGLATIVPKENDERRMLILFADECLYEAKNKGRNRVEVHNYKSKENA